MDCIGFFENELIVHQSFHDSRIPVRDIDHLMFELLLEVKARQSHTFFQIFLSIPFIQSISLLSPIFCQEDQQNIRLLIS
jgi:hypothetical protein